MNEKEALMVIKNINSDVYTESEKVEAISLMAYKQRVNDWASRERLTEAMKWMLTRLKWTPTAERLPEKEGIYLCSVRDYVTGKMFVTSLEYGKDIAPEADEEYILPNGYAFGDRWSDGMDSLCKVYAWRSYPEAWGDEPDIISKEAVLTLPRRIVRGDDGEVIGEFISVEDIKKLGRCEE